MLLVDSDASRATTVANWLMGSGHEVDFAHDSDAALSLVHGHRFDACMIAATSRDPQGANLCRRLRGEGVACPIVILLADASLKSLLAGFDAGADDVFRAPVDMREVLAKLVNLVHPVKVQMQREIRVGSLCLDLSTQTLRGRSAVFVNGMT